MRKSFFPKKVGFSLLEMLIVLAIALLLGGVAFPQLNRYWQSYRLDSRVDPTARHP